MQFLPGIQRRKIIIFRYLKPTSPLKRIGIKSKVTALLSLKRLPLSWRHTIDT
jgi:hypothetical protein